MIRTLSLALMVVLVAGSAAAQTLPSDDAVAIGVTAGTPGLGVEAQFRLGSIFVLRGGVDILTHDFDETYDGIDYAGQIDFDTAGGFIELHPFANGFMLSGGAYVGDRNVSLDATPTMPVNIGGQTFTPSQVGTLNGTIKLKAVTPFVGMGFDNTFTRATRWGFRGIVGVALTEEPEVALDSRGGTLSNDLTFRARLANEARSIQSDAEDYGLFPVVQLGLNYRF